MIQTMASVQSKFGLNISRRNNIPNLFLNVYNFKENTSLRIQAIVSHHIVARFKKKKKQKTRLRLYLFLRCVVRIYFLCVFVVFCDGFVRPSPDGRSREINRTVTAAMR